MMWRRFLVSVIAALYFGALIGLTFVPGSAANRIAWFWPFAAFVPVGILLVLLLGRRRWWAALAFSVLGAAWIEAAQTVWMPAGYAEAADVMWASAGAITGVVIVLIVTSPRLRSMRSHQAPRIVPQAGTREIPQD
jgi:glycopeptide antibiotics resistance protein